ncbi:MAG TPA: lmo0937 family membrane protein [Bacillales bacterium]
MLWTIIILLVILWALGLISHIIGGLIHVLLIAAVIVLAIKLLRKIF